MDYSEKESDYGKVFKVAGPCKFRLIYKKYYIIYIY